jgi:hypothetical protein
VKVVFKKEPSATPPSDDIRCACGSLIARRVPNGVELKCRRCKRTFVVPLLEEGQ